MDAAGVAALFFFHFYYPPAGQSGEYFRRKESMHSFDEYFPAAGHYDSAFFTQLAEKLVGGGTFLTVEGNLKSKYFPPCVPAPRPPSSKLGRYIQGGP